MEELQQFIRTTRDAREVKRALAVQASLAGRPRATIASELGYSVAWVKKWCRHYRSQGIEGLKVGYKGSTGYLMPEQHAAIITWLQAQTQWDVPTLARHIDTTYGVRYQSPKSYYTLLHEARMSWKKSQDTQPKANPTKVAEAQTQIKKKTAEEAPALVRKQSVMLMVDECHLLWGDARGYVWGPTGQRLVIPIENIRERQTYYGALNLLTGQTTVWEAATGNMDYTVGFLTYLRQFYQGRRMVICWDRASYHRGHMVQEYLTRINGPACPESERRIQIELFAPHAPVQNPMEDVWLRGKRAVRQHWFDLQTFHDVKTIFTQTITYGRFSSQKLNWYGRDDLIIQRRNLGYQWE